jgi:predicted enzyme related to lactoylglutathione lyase
MLRFQCICIDTPAPRALATFWQAVLGWTREEDDDGEVVLTSTEGGPHMPDLLFLRVDDERVVKNRLHIDLRPDDQAAEVERVLSLGARRVDIGQGDVTWVVLADPEGNEFCILRAFTDDERVRIGLA